MVGGFADVHQNLVFDTPGSVSRQLDLLVQPVGADGLDQADGTNGNQVLQVDAGVFKPPGNVNYQPQVVLYQTLFGRFVPPLQGFQGFLLLLSLQGRGQHIASADVKDGFLPK